MSDIDNLLRVLADNALYEQKLKDLNSKIEEHKELYKKVQSERGKIELEREKLESLKEEIDPRLKAIDAATKKISEQEAAIKEIIKIAKTLG